jgi:Uma2 family endonuclease
MVISRGKIMSDPAVIYDESRRWSYTDYKNWELKPGERYELINGIAYAMAAPGTQHQLIAAALYGEFYAFLKGKPCKAIPAPFDVRLFYEEDGSDDTVVQPDLSVVCDPAKLGMEGCRGAPELVVEILSPSNSVLEMYRKRDLYFESGVREYWLIDPDRRIVAVYHVTNGKYLLQSFESADTIQSEVLPGLEITAGTLFV